MSEWVKCSERMPDKTGEYRTLQSFGRIAILPYYTTTQAWNVGKEDRRHNEIMDITHWMPLPEPPAEERKP